MPAKQGAPGEGQDEGTKNQTVALFDPLSPALLWPRSRVLPEEDEVYGTAVGSAVFFFLAGFALVMKFLGRLGPTGTQCALILPV